MSRFKQCIFALAGLVALVGGMSVFSPAPGYTQAGAKPPTDVNVINTPNVNVANTPGVNVANTPTVSVGNTPSVNAQQSGSWITGLTSDASVAINNTPSVTLSGSPTVTVGNTATNPVLVRNTDSSALQPVALTAFVAINNDISTQSPTTLYTVPAGKRLVVQNVNIYGDSAVGGTAPFPNHYVVTVYGHTPGTSRTFKNTFNVTTTAQAGNFPTTMYIDPGQELDVTAFQDLFATTELTVSVSGYLVNAQ